MAQVLRISPTHENPFSSTGLRRTTSQNSLRLDNQAASQCNASDSLARRYSSSLSSSAPSSPRLNSHDLSSLPSCSSTPASCLSLRDQFATEETEIQFPAFCDESENGTSDGEDVTPSNSPPRSSEADLASRPQHSKPYHNTHRKRQSVGDDLALESQPSRHVDYLSHDWKEEEIWSSWKHVVGKRKNLDNWERLENASWRTWAKSRGGLPTVSPAALNWMKDHDVTWLYGPLQSGRMPRLGVASPSSTTRLSRSDSFATKKSILKKRSLSEAMLQRSWSSSTLVKQAVDSLVSRGPNTSRNQATMGSRAIPEASRIASKSFSTPTDTPFRTFSSSSSSSGAQTPGERRRIHFSEKVEQCIAINKDGEFDQEVEETESQTSYDSDESDDGALMMQAEKGKERRLSSSRSGTPRSSFSSDSSQKTIAMLPSTKLRGDTPEPPEPARLGETMLSMRGPLAKSSSQETLKPSRPSSNFLLGNDQGQQSSSHQTRPSNSHASRSSYHHSLSPAPSGPFTDEDEEMESRGLRRTASGMFMPYDDNEEECGADGVMGKVVNVVNTAKDILHVVWNVGWQN